MGLRTSQQSFSGPGDHRKAGCDVALASDDSAETACTVMDMSYVEAAFYGPLLDSSPGMNCGQHRDATINSYSTCQRKAGVSRQEVFSS